MKAPDKKPPILTMEKGLEDINSTILLEKYVQTFSGNAMGIKIFENRNVYKVSLPSNKNIKDEHVIWKKVGTLDADDIEKLKKIYTNHSLTYIKNPNQKVLNKPLSSNYWYFHFDKEKYAYTQEQRFRRSPKFARKMDKIFRKL